MKRNKIDVNHYLHLVTNFLLSIYATLFLLYALYKALEKCNDNLAFFSAFVLTFTIPVTIITFTRIISFCIHIISARKPIG